MKLRFLSLLAALPLFAACSPAPSGDAAQSSQDQTEDTPFDLMHTRPECHHDGHPTTWCTRDDVGPTAALSGMEKRINAILDRAVDPATSKILIAYFSFSAKGVFTKLCEKGKAGFDIEGFFDQSYRMQLPAQLMSCQGPSGKNVRIHFLGQLSQVPYVWRLHHNKFLIVDSGDERPVSVNFSSGNLSSYGISEHFDHWALLTAPRASSLVKMHLCVAESLRKAINPEGAAVDQQIDDPNLYRSSLDACLSAQQTFFAPGTQWVEHAIDAEKIAPLFSPDPAGANAQILVENIGRVKPGGKIYGAMQHFLHYGIASALRSAAQRGVSVRLVMDAALISGQSEVPGVKPFYDSYLKESVSGMKVQFLVVNSPEFQMMHNKFLVMEGLDGDKTRVFSGAGHFSDAGLRDNYENFYLSQSDVLSAKYNELFGYLWQRTVTEAQVLDPSSGTPDGGM
jgi:hypothetical protein